MKNTVLEHSVKGTRSQSLGFRNLCLEGAVPGAWAGARSRAVAGAGAGARAGPRARPGAGSGPGAGAVSVAECLGPKCRVAKGPWARGLGAGTLGREV